MTEQETLNWILVILEEEKKEQIKFLETRIPEMEEERTIEMIKRHISDTQEAIDYIKDLKKY